MPSKSPAQARLMAAAAHTPGGYGGVPESVGKEFNQMDKGTKMLHRANEHKHPAHGHDGKPEHSMDMDRGHIPEKHMVKGVHPSLPAKHKASHMRGRG